jgi:hypothetical protein
LREYRFRFDKKRRALIQDALSGLIHLIDSDIRTIKTNLSPDIEENAKMKSPSWEMLQYHVSQIATLLGSSLKKPLKWDYLLRHLHFGMVSDFHDIEKMDWPSIKIELRESLYGVNDPIHVQVKDLSDLVSSRPQGPVATRLHWDRLSPDEFERLIFALISSEQGYENPECLCSLMLLIEAATCPLLAWPSIDFQERFEAVSLSNASTGFHAASGFLM